MLISISFQRSVSCLRSGFDFKNVFAPITGNGHSRTLFRKNGEPFPLYIMKTLNETVISPNVASLSDITPCIKIDKPLVAYRCWYGRIRFIWQPKISLWSYDK